MNSVRLRLQHVAKSFYPAAGPAVRALNDISFEIHQNEFAVVVGQNGSGKTTLLNAIYGNVAVDTGLVEVEQGGRLTALATLSRRQRAQCMSMVQQDPRLGTVPDLTIWENLRLTGLSNAPALPFRFSSRAQIEKEFGSVLGRLSLLPRLGSHARDLSGGERQLAAIVMALVRRPSLVLLDEATASLDRRNAATCMSQARQLSREYGITVLAVTHDLNQALEYADRLLVMKEGRVTHDFADERRHTLTLPTLIDACGMFAMPATIGPTELEPKAV